MTGQMVEIAPPEALTAKQREVVKLLIDCHSTKEIARILEISPSTVEQRLAAARRKFGKISRRELQRLFRQSDHAKLDQLWRAESEAHVESLASDRPLLTERHAPNRPLESASNPTASNRQIILAIVTGVLLGWLTSVVAAGVGFYLGRLVD